MKIWKAYFSGLESLEQEGFLKLPRIPDHASNNAHMFYLLCKNVQERSGLIEHLKKKKVLTVFHYLSLHKSPFYSDKHDGRELRNADHYSDVLVRLPFFYELTFDDIDFIVNEIKNYFHA